MNLVLLESHELAADGGAHLSDGRARHIASVLRVTAGDRVRVGVVDGPTGVGVVTAIDAAGVALACTFDPTVPEPPAVDLLLAVPRPKVLNRLWAQLAAMGVGRVMLTNAERVERPYFDTHVLEPAHYRPLLIEGLQQARDTRLPLVTVHRRFRVLVEDELDALSDAAVRIVGEACSGTSIRDAVRDAIRAPGRADDVAHPRVLLAVGPEGGWNGFELDLLAAHGFVAVDMGPRTLRSDTACLALLALVHEARRG